MASASVEEDAIDKTETLVELFDMIYLDTTPSVDENICKIISKRIKTKETSLLTVIEELGLRLTSTHVQERSKAVEILAHVFTNIPSDFLKEKELSFIVDFLCDRCKDQHMVIPKIIMCALPIVKCKELPTGAGTRVLDILFREANVQSHIHKIRNTFFRILQAVLSSEENIEELQNMSSDFIMNFLQSMDGEKDPRNLLLLFRIIPKVISKFKLDPFTEDFFEILSCYFPIDFNPTVPVPGQEIVTRNDLSKALHTCLSQTNEFAEFLLPLVLDKLESSLTDAKLDSLELLRLCCTRSYVPRDLEPYLGQIWHVMRKEIFMGGNDEVEKKCYEFLKAAFALISKDEAILNTCLTMIYSECKHHLSEPELRLIVPTSNLLQCIAESGQVACSSVAENLFPVVYEQVCSKSSKNEKKRLLGIWETLISTSRQYKNINFATLVPKWEEMKALWFTLLTNEDWELVKTVLRIFSIIVVTDKNFTEDHRNMLQEHLLQLTGTSYSNARIPQDTRSAAVTLSSSLCSNFGDEFANISVPRLLNTVTHSASTPPEELLCNNKCTEVNTFPCQSQELSVRILGECSHLHQSVFDKVVARLLEKLDSDPANLVCLKCLGSIVQSSFQHNTTSSEYIKPDLYHALGRVSMGDKVISLAFKICKLLKLHLEEAKSMTSDSLISASDQNKTSKLLHESLLQATATIRIILQNLDENEQVKLMDSYWNGKINNAKDLEDQLADIPGLLVESILGSVKSSVEISMRMELINYIFEKVVMLTTVDSDAFREEFHTLPFTRLLAGFVNKAKEKMLTEYLNVVDSYVQKSITDHETSCNKISDDSMEETANPLENDISTLKVNLIQALIWIVKGLAMRGFPQLDLWVEKFITFLKYEGVGEEVISRCHYLMADDPFSLNAESFCRFMFLYRQRLFLMLVDKLVEGYKNSMTKSIQYNCIRALSAQLKYVPSEILFIKIDSVLPLLVASLKCNSSSQVLLSTLNALSEMMESPETKNKLTEYSSDLVPQLTRLSQLKESMNVRIMSLNCLRKCAKAPTHIILPLRDDVVEALVQPLDDPKRLVRKEAMLTRNLWILIGAPGGLQ